MTAQLVISRAWWHGCSRVALLFLAGSFAVGCVSYEKYKDLTQQLERTREANEDLIKKYNQMLVTRGGGEAGDSDAYLAKIRDLQRQLEEARAGGPSFTPSEIPHNASIEGGGLALGESLLFSPGSADLKPGASRVLDDVVALLQSQYPNETVLIEGHTDTQQLNRTRKIWQDNMNLAYNRARAVFRYFLNHGIRENRMIITAFSYNKPVQAETAHTVDGMRANRRVVVRRTGQAPVISTPVAAASIPTKY